MKKKNKAVKISPKRSAEATSTPAVPEFSFFRPFEGLSRQILKRYSSRPDSSTRQMSSKTIEQNPSSLTQDASMRSGAACEDDMPSDMHLFWEEVKGIVPINESSPIFPKQPFSKKVVASLIHEHRQDMEVIHQLDAICKGVAMVNVSQTPEFVEGGGWNLNVNLARKLHKGKFSVQAYCDLHGLDVRTSLEVCEEFMKDALSHSRKCVAFIHGRGLSSKKEPVIKNMFLKWITNGPYRRFVLAYSSAPARDGGAGVTYVLLRQQPARRRRKT